MLHSQVLDEGAECPGPVVTEEARELFEDGVQHPEAISLLLRRRLLIACRKKAVPWLRWVHMTAVDFTTAIFARGRGGRAAAGLKGGGGVVVAGEPVLAHAVCHSDFWPSSTRRPAVDNPFVGDIWRRLGVLGQQVIEEFGFVKRREVAERAFQLALDFVVADGAEGHCLARPEILGDTADPVVVASKAHLDPDQSILRHQSFRSFPD